MKHPELTKTERRTLAKLLVKFRQGREMSGRDFQALLNLRRKTGQSQPRLFSAPHQTRLRRKAEEQRQQWGYGRS